MIFFQKKNLKKKVNFCRDLPYVLNRLLKLDDKLSSKRDRALSVWGRPIYSTAHHPANEWEQEGGGGAVHSTKANKSTTDSKRGANFFISPFALRHLRKEKPDYITLS